jgi:monoamine oxidase
VQRAPSSSSRRLSSITSRRAFLAFAGKIGGAAAVYQTMVAMGMIPTPPAWAGPLQIAAGSGAGKNVVILGAGIAGMAAAYELGKAGYTCTILEPLDRPGGRNFTARNGTRVVETSGANRTVQTCAFDDGLYMNLGPARLPFHHPRVMHYCREFAIPLEIYVMSSTANLYQSDTAFGGKAMPRYRVSYDTSSYVAELLTKAVNQHALDAAVTADDRTLLLDMLQKFGDLPSSGPATVGGETPRTNCLEPMTIEALCAANPRLPLHELLALKFWQHRYFQPDEGEWQPTLFQPIGGMDKIVDAFVSRVGRTIRYNSEAIEIVNGRDGVDVVARDRATGATTRIHADYCLSNMPLARLAKIKTNLAPDLQRAIASAQNIALYKLAFQANRRFWEEEPYKIYGGISYTDNPITQMWYPSNGYHEKSGIIAGSYSYADQAEAFGRMSLTERITAGRRDAIKMHREFADESLVPANKAVSIAWNLAEGQSGGVTQWHLADSATDRNYKRLLAGDGRVSLIGDQISLLGGWQEGAFLSSELALSRIVHAG